MEAGKQAAEMGWEVPAYLAHTGGHHLICSSRADLQPAIESKTVWRELWKGRKRIVWHWGHQPASPSFLLLPHLWGVLWGGVRHRVVMLPGLSSLCSIPSQEASSDNLSLSPASSFSFLTLYICLTWVLSLFSSLPSLSFPAFHNVSHRRAAQLLLRPRWAPGWKGWVTVSLWSVTAGLRNCTRRGNCCLRL